MFCPQCGLRIPNGRTTCIACSMKGRPPTASAPPSERFGTTSGRAIASLVLGIVWVYGIGAILAIVLGHLAVADIRRSHGSIRGRGLAIAGFILGYIGVAGAAIALVLGAVALPGIRAVRKQNEHTVTALSGTLSIMNALEAYSTNYPDQGYPETLTALGGSLEGMPSVRHALLLDNNLADAGLIPYDGYRFKYEPGDSWNQIVCSGITSCTGFTLHVDPLPGTSGRHFYTDETGVIRYNDDGPAGPLNAPVEH